MREIKPEEMWLYQYPVQPSYVPTTQLWLIVFGVPLLIFFTRYYTTKDKTELTRSLLCLTLNFGLNGFVTCFLKVLVGRPRPDFFYRCFPDGKGTDPRSCTGDPAVAMDGRKSFPSGHSSFAFASMVFSTLYLNRKLRVFDPANNGNSLRFIAAFSPLLVAASIAISRTCDYHHHWQGKNIVECIKSRIKKCNKNWKNYFSITIIVF